jgi:DTW domain-containing protein YfiP
LLYPGKEAEVLEDFLPNLVIEQDKIQCDSSTEDEIKNLNVRVVFVDSTWNQTARILNHPNVKYLRKIKIDDRETVFWRYQTGKSKKHLATIEAIYYFLVDFHVKVLKKSYNGEYDQLLFLYKFMYGKIHQLYDRSKLRSYNR